MTERVRETDDGTYPNVEEEQEKNKAREVPYARSFVEQYEQTEDTPSTLIATQNNKWAIESLCERSHAIAKEKGWCETPRPIYSITNLMQSELAEALEEFRAHHPLSEIYYEEKKVASDAPKSQRCEIGYHQPTATGYCSCWTIDKKPCGIPIELADCLIRIAQYCGTEGLPLQDTVSKLMLMDVHERGDRLFERILGRDVDFELMLARANYYISRAFVTTFEDDSMASRLTGLVSLGRAWIAIFDFCNQDLPGGNIKLWAAIDEKEAYNKSRPYRHGGKKV